MLSHTFKKIIEQFDPDTHQFFPIAIRSKSNKFAECLYFLFNCCILKDLIDTEKSGIHITYINGRRLPTGKISLETILRNDDSSGHVWREEVCPNELFLSDAIFDALKDTGAKEMRAHAVYNVPETKVFHKVKTM